jgi:hypothetical protein
MNIEKTTAAFSADCLSHMPPQKGEIKIVVDAAKAGLTRIANGQEWPEGEADLAAKAAWAASDAAAWAAAWAAYWAAGWAADAATDEAGMAAYWVAYWAARAHPDPDAERARQAKVRDKLGLNTEGA